jgi:hypothetical protein
MNGTTPMTTLTSAALSAGQVAAPPRLASPNAPRLNMRWPVTVSNSAAKSQTPRIALAAWEANQRVVVTVARYWADDAPCSGR